MSISPSIVCHGIMVYDGSNCIWSHKWPLAFNEVARFRVPEQYV
jgi:hypothetical protein